VSPSAAERTDLIQKKTYSELRSQLLEFADLLVHLGKEWKDLQLDIDDEAQRLAAVVRDSNDAITLQDLRGNILAWNHGAEQMYGWSEKEALRMNIRETVPTDAVYDTTKIVQRVLLGDNVTSFETQRLTKNGRTLEVWLTLTALKDSRAEVVAVASTERDITERKKIEREKEQYLQEALVKLKVLGGMLPICASCKKIRDDQGYWNQIESYIRDHSQAEFSHSLCPHCAKTLYPNLNLTSTQTALRSDS
jgi:PAS domain S-box-containing protein